MSSKFVHLHTHSEYSLLDGSASLKHLIRRTQELEMPGLALTDHGVMFGAHRFHSMAHKAGIRPIIGMEAYVAPGDRRDKTERTIGGRPYSHLVLLARDLEGYRNLVKLSSYGFTEGMYYKPRIDHELLAKHNQGIVVTSACLAGEVAQALHAGSYDEARRIAEWYANTFKDRYFLEVQAHDSEGQAELNSQIFKIADEIGIPVIATNDVHFVGKDDHASHDVLLCIGMRKELEDQDRMHYDEGLYFRSAEEMEGRFPGRPDVLENTLAICEATDLVFEQKYYVPRFPLPEHVESEDVLLRKITEDGAKLLYGDPLPEDARARVDFELDVIQRLGYSGYFLILADVIEWARDNDIGVGPGRGSAAGSIVAYCTGITDLCPLKYDLLFERFLNPERQTMPDIDTDFSQEGRQAVIEYIRSKYGDDAVCQIVTFGTMKARAAIKDVGRVLGFAPDMTNRIASQIPNDPNHALTVKDAQDEIPEIAALAQSDNSRERDLVDYASRLEGLARHASIHAAGVVIAPGPIEDYVPVATLRSATKAEPVKVTQYDMNSVEQAGLLKMDFLGIKTLDVIDYARSLVRRRHSTAVAFSLREAKRIKDTHPGVDVRVVDVEDQAAYALLRTGMTHGVFQLEKEWAAEKVRSMGVDRFEDIVAVGALIRPGPLDTGMTDQFIRRKRGEAPVEYLHPALEPILEPTLGIIVYQEQVMRAAQLMAGFSLAEADVLRKAVGKKDAALIRKELGRLKKRLVANNIGVDIADTLCSEIEAFGRYGFNKSHAAAYGLLTFQTAWLKGVYPAEFMAALLSYESNDDLPKTLREAKRMGIPVLHPDVNESTLRFNVVEVDGKPGIRFGLGAVKFVGDVASRIIDERTVNGPFEDFYDFVQRAFILGCNKRQIQALIGSGALDRFGHRGQLTAAIDLAVGHAQQAKKEADTGQMSMFGDLMSQGEDASEPVFVLPNVPPLPLKDILEEEKSLVGIYIAGHPLDQVEGSACVVRTHEIVDLNTSIQGEVRLVGMLTSVEEKASRRGSRYCVATIEDASGSQSVRVFGRTWESLKDTLKEGEICTLVGTVKQDSMNEDRIDFVVDDAEPLEVSVNNMAVRIRLKSMKDSLAELIRATLAEHPGPAPVQLALGSQGFRVANSRVKPSDRLLRELRHLVDGVGEVDVVPDESAVTLGRRRR